MVARCNWPAGPTRDRWPSAKSTRASAKDEPRRARPVPIRRRSAQTLGKSRRCLDVRRVGSPVGGQLLQVATTRPARAAGGQAQGSSYGFREGYPFYFFNVLEELDQPGEWYLDRAAGLIYLFHRTARRNRRRSSRSCPALGGHAERGPCGAGEPDLRVGSGGRRSDDGWRARCCLAGCTFQQPGRQRCDHSAAAPVTASWAATSTRWAAAASAWPAATARR